MSINNGNRLIFSYIGAAETSRINEISSLTNHNVVFFSDLNSEHSIYLNNTKYSTNADAFKAELLTVINTNKDAILTEIVGTKTKGNYGEIGKAINKAVDIAMARSWRGVSNTNKSAFKTTSVGKELETRLNTNINAVKTELLTDITNTQADVNTLTTNVSTNLTSINNLSKTVFDVVNCATDTTTKFNVLDTLNNLAIHSSLNYDVTSSHIYSNVKDDNTGNIYNYIYVKTKNSTSSDVDKAGSWIKTLVKRELTESEVVSHIGFGQLQYVSETDEAGTLYNKILQVSSEYNLNIDKNSISGLFNRQIAGAISTVNITTNGNLTAIPFISTGSAALDTSDFVKYSTLPAAMGSTSLYKVPYVNQGKLYMSQSIFVTTPEESGQLALSSKTVHLYRNTKDGYATLGGVYAGEKIFPYIDNSTNGNNIVEICHGIKLSPNYGEVQAGVKATTIMLNTNNKSSDITLTLPSQSGTIMTQENLFANSVVDTDRYYLVGTKTNGGLLYSRASVLNADLRGPYMKGETLYYSSDERVKNNIKPLSSAIKNKIIEIPDLIKSFKYNNEDKITHGVIAQEIIGIIPDSVNYDKDFDRYAVDYNSVFSAMIGTLLDKVREQDKRISELEKLIK